MTLGSSLPLHFPAAFVASLIEPFIEHWLAIRRDDRNAKRMAADKFRNAVLTTLTGIYPLQVNWPENVDAKLRAVFPELQAAVAEFRPRVPLWWRWDFDRAWFRYRCSTGRQIDLQCYHHYIAFGSNPDPKGNFRRNVAKILAFAK